MTGLIELVMVGTTVAGIMLWLELTRYSKDYHNGGGRKTRPPLNFN